ncbi:MAG: hypothetical protein NT154_15720 [Verrucomicrobia bacterium]|nr:hypothetical protein [Verrucomicrobiota bacterium]
MTVNLAANWKSGTALMEVVDPGLVATRNTLAKLPVAVVPSVVNLQGNTTTFKMPALSVGAVTSTRAKQ